LLEPELKAHVENYAHSHATPVNKALHFLGIPVLMVALLGLIAKVAYDWGALPPLQPNLGWPVLLFASAWYLRMDRRIGLVSVLTLVLCYALGCYLSLSLLFALLALGAILHIVGHYGFEGKPPALLSTPIAILEAPPWLFATWAGWKAPTPSSGSPPSKT
jgi:uncharacterized membrane protein YGL010W